MRGVIVLIDRARQAGEIRRDDGTRSSFDREGMVRWLQFEKLQPGDRVTYDLDSSGAAINVERDGESPGQP